MAYSLILRKLGVNIRAIRKTKQISMEELSFKCKIDYRQIGRIERGEINTTVISLARIAHELEVDLFIFFLDLPPKTENTHR